MNTRRFFLALAAIATVLIIPKAATAHEPHTIAPISTAVMSSSTSGFYNARAARPRTAITVGNIPTLIPSVAGYTNAQVIFPWNYTAGWPMFKLTNSNYIGQILWKADLAASAPRSAWVQRIDGPGAGNWYSSCVIHYKPGTLTFIIAKHEIGHCLGFNDHIQILLTTGCTSDGRQCAGPTQPQCNAPTRPYYSNYTGEFSYCTFYNASLHFGAHDRASLYVAGYRPATCVYPNTNCAH